MATAREKKAAQIVREEIRHAKANMGNGWNYIATGLREGLIAKGVLAVLHLQDESISAEARLDLMRACVAEMHAAQNRDEF